MLNDSEIGDPNDTDIVIPILKQVRRITKMFRKSPKKNDILQSYVREIRNGKEQGMKGSWADRVSAIQFILE